MIISVREKQELSGANDLWIKPRLRGDARTADGHTAEGLVPISRSLRQVQVSLFLSPVEMRWKLSRQTQIRNHNPKSLTHCLKPEIRKQKPKTQKPKFNPKNPKPKTQNPKLEIQNLKPKTQNPKPKTLKPKTKPLHHTSFTINYKR